MKKKIIIITSSIVLVLLIGLSVKPVYNLVKEKRAESLFLKAKALHADGGNITEVLDLLKSSYSLDSKSIEANKFMAKVYEDLNSPLSVLFWSDVYSQSKDPDDLYNWLRLSLKYDNMKALNENFGLLEDTYDNKLNLYFLKAQLRFKQAQIEESMRLMQEVVRDEQATPDMLFFYIQLTQLTGDLEHRQEGIKYLEKLSDRDDNVGLFALRNLMAVSNIDYQVVFNKLKNHPLKERQDESLLLYLQYNDAIKNKDPKQLDVFYDKLISLYDLDNDNDLVELGRWFNMHKMHSKTVELIDKKRAFNRKDLFLVWVDAKAILGEWDEIDLILSSDNVPLEDFFLNLFKVRVLFEQGDRKRADNAWSKLLYEAANSNEKLWFMTSYAKRLGYTDHLRTMYQFLSNNPALMRRAYQEWLSLELAQKNTEGIVTILKKMAEVYPNDKAVQNDLTYMKLLRKEDLTNSSKVAEDLLMEKPNELTYRITYALAQLRLGNNEEAMKWVSGFDMNWNRVRSGWRIVVGIVYHLNGQLDQADKLVLSVNQSLLLDEESELLTEYLN